MELSISISFLLQDVSEVGKAAISLEKVFNKLLNDKFSLMEGNSKIQRKR